MFLFSYDVGAEEKLQEVEFFFKKHAPVSKFRNFSCSISKLGQKKTLMSVNHRVDNRCLMLTLHGNVYQFEVIKTSIQ